MSKRTLNNTVLYLKYTELCPKKTAKCASFNIFTAKLIGAFVFAYAKCWFTDAAHFTTVRDACQCS